MMRRRITLKTYNATRRIKIMDERIWVAGHRVSKDDPQAAPLWWECCVKAGCGWVVERRPVLSRKGDCTATYLPFCLFA